VPWGEREGSLPLSIVRGLSPPLYCKRALSPCVPWGEREVTIERGERGLCALGGERGLQYVTTHSYV